MQETPAPQSNPFQYRQPEAIAQGVWANAMVASHSREEFFLDFIATYAMPSRLAARVLLNPAHTKRLVKTLRDNLDIYVKAFGPLAEIPAETKTANTVQAQELYSQLTVPDAVLAGSYANNVLIRHTREEFILDFLMVCQPNPVLVARVLVHPAHIQRIANVLEARVKVYEEAFGSMEDPPAPPEPPEPRPRFSLS